MATTAEINGNELEVSVKYGIVGAGCTARMPRGEAAGLTARQLVESVLRRQPLNGSGHWIGRVLDEVLQSDREVDVELSLDSSGEVRQGDPIALHQVVVLPAPDAEKAQPAKLTVSLSESYRGGASWTVRRMDGVRHRIATSCVG